MFSNHRLTVFFPFCCFVNLFKTFPVLPNYWYFLCYFLHPIITFFWSKDLVLLVFQVISGKANCLTCERCSLNMWRIRLQQHISFEISLNSWKVAFVSYLFCISNIQHTTLAIKNVSFELLRKIFEVFVWFLYFSFKEKSTSWFNRRILSVIFSR